jgi:hypothetical protein
MHAAAVAVTRLSPPTHNAVMAGLVPAIHVLILGQKFVDARHKAGA